MTLLAIRHDPVIALNRLVAVSFRDSADIALQDLPHIEDELVGYSRLPAIRADLLRRAGRNREAAPAYRKAISQWRADAERLFLERRLTEVEASPS
jgi:RNA polymerase sigma-70 factor, ECF subfamily